MTSLTWDRHRGHASGYDVSISGSTTGSTSPVRRWPTAPLGPLDTDNARERRRPLHIAGRSGRCSGVFTPHAGRSQDATPANHLFTVVLARGDRPRRRASDPRRAGGSKRACTIRLFTASRLRRRTRPPHTEDYARRAVTLPLFPTISEEQIGWVVDSLERAWRPSSGIDPCGSLSSASTSRRRSPRRQRGCTASRRGWSRRGNHGRGDLRGAESPCRRR